MTNVILENFEHYRYTIPENAYDTLTYQERALYKDTLAFLYAYYTAQYTHATLCTQTCSLYTVTTVMQPYNYLLAMLPENVSIPPLLSLIVPAHILSIPIYLIFRDATFLSHHLLVALELSGVENIFITEFEEAYTFFATQMYGLYITSGTFTVHNPLLHYTPPSLWKNAKKGHHAHLYPDATYNNATQTSPAHIWLYPTITIASYIERSFSIIKNTLPE